MEGHLIKKYNLRVIAVLFFFTFYGCATPTLWKATDPNKYVEVSADYISEEHLTSKGITYHRDDKRGVYYIEKDNLAKLKDYTVRVFATPVSVMLDATLSILVVGTLGVLWIIDSDLDNEKKERQQKRDKCSFDPDCPYDKNGLYRY